MAEDTDLSFYDAPLSVAEIREDLRGAIYASFQETLGGASPAVIRGFVESAMEEAGIGKSVTDPRKIASAIASIVDGKTKITVKGKPILPERSRGIITTLTDEYPNLQQKLRVATFSKAQQRAQAEKIILERYVARLADAGLNTKRPDLKSALNDSGQLRGQIQKVIRKFADKGVEKEEEIEQIVNDFIETFMATQLRSRLSGRTPTKYASAADKAAKVPTKAWESHDKESKRIQSILGELGFATSSNIKGGITRSIALRIRSISMSDMDTAAMLLSVLSYNANGKPRSLADLGRFSSDFSKLVKAVSGASGKTVEERFARALMGMGEDRLRGWVQRNREIIEKGGLPLPFVPVFNAKGKLDIKATLGGYKEGSSEYRRLYKLASEFTTEGAEGATGAAIKRKGARADRAEARAATRTKRAQKKLEIQQAKEDRENTFKGAKEISAKLIGKIVNLGASPKDAFKGYVDRLKEIRATLKSTSGSSASSTNTVSDLNERRKLAAEASAIGEKIGKLVRADEVFSGLKLTSAEKREIKNLRLGVSSGRIESANKILAEAQDPATGNLSIPDKARLAMERRLTAAIHGAKIDLTSQEKKIIVNGIAGKIGDSERAALVAAALSASKNINQEIEKIKREVTGETKKRKILDIFGKTVALAAATEPSPGVSVAARKAVSKILRDQSKKQGPLHQWQEIAQKWMDAKQEEFRTAPQHRRMIITREFHDGLRQFVMGERSILASIFGQENIGVTRHSAETLFDKYLFIAAQDKNFLRTANVKKSGMQENSEAYEVGTGGVFSYAYLSGDRRLLSADKAQMDSARVEAGLIKAVELVSAVATGSGSAKISGGTIVDQAEFEQKRIAERLAKQDRAKKLIQEILSGDKAAFNDPAKMLELVGYIAGGRGKGAVATNLIAQALAEVAKGGKLSATADQISKIASLFKISREGKIEGPGGARLLGAGLQSADLARQLIRALDPKFQDKEGTQYGKVLAETLGKALAGDKGLFGKVFGKKAQADLAKAAEETKTSMEAADARRAKREAGGPVTRTRAAKGKLGDLKRVVDADGNESFVDAKGLPIGLKGKGFKHQGQVPAGSTGLGKYLVKQGLIAKPGDLETTSEGRGSKPVIDLSKTKFVSETAKQIAGIVQDVRAKAMGIDPKTGASVGKMAAGSLRELAGGTGFAKGTAGKQAKAEFAKIVSEVMSDPSIVRKFSKGGVKQSETAPEFEARRRAELSGKYKREATLESTIQKDFIKKFGAAAAAAISAKTGVPVGAGNAAIAERLMQGKENAAEMAALRSRLAARQIAGQGQLLGGGRVPKRYGGQSISYDQNYRVIPIYARSTRTKAQWKQGGVAPAAAPSGGGGGGSQYVTGGPPIVMPNVDLSGLKQIVADMNLIAQAANSIPQIKTGAKLAGQLNTIADTLSAVAKVQGTPSIKNIRAIGRLFDPSVKESIPAMAQKMGKTDGVGRLADAAKGINRVLKAFDGLGAGVGTSPKDFSARMAGIQKIGNSIGKAFNGIIGSVQSIDLGGLSGISEQIRAIKAPKTGELDKVLQALAKVQQILDAASGLKYGGIRGGQAAISAARSGRASGAGGVSGASMTSGWKRGNRDAFNPKYEKGEVAQIRQGQKALAEKVNSEYGKFISDALANPSFARGISLVKSQKGASGPIKTNLQREFDEARQRIAAEKIAGSVKAAQRRYDATGQLDPGMKRGAGGSVAMRADSVRRIQAEASQAAMAEVFKTFRSQLSRYVRPMFAGAVREFRDMARPIARAAAQRSFSSGSFPGQSRASQFPAPQRQQQQYQRGGSGSRSGGGGGGGSGFGGPRMPGGNFPQDAAQPRFGTQGVGQFANDTMGILGNLAQQIRFGFTQEITREIAQSFGRVIAHLKDGVIQFNSVLETATVAFQTLFENEQKNTGTGLVNVERAREEAEKMVAAIQRFANVTPFRFPQLAESARRMRAFGFETQEILPNMQAIGDAVAALGGEDDKIFRITYALGQMRQSGRVYQNDMMQLANAGIAGYDILSKALLQDFVKTGELSLKYNGKVIDQASVQSEEGLNMLVRAVNAATTDATRGQVAIAGSSSAEIKAIFERVSNDPIEAIRDLTQAGKIGGVEASQAIIDGLSQEYGGGMRKLAKTFQGAFSTLADVSQYFVARVTEPIYNAIRDVMVDVGLMLQSSHATKIVDNIAAGFKTIIPRLSSSAFGLYDIFVKTFSGIGDFFTGAMERVGRGMAVGKDALSMLSNGLNAIGNLLEYKVVAAMIGAAVAAKAMAVAFSMNPMLAAIALIIFGAGQLQSMISSMPEIGTALRGHLGTIESMSRQISNVIAPIIQRIVGAMSGSFMVAFIGTLAAALPIIEKMLMLFEIMLNVLNSLPFIPELMGFGLAFILLRKMLSPLASVLMGAKAGVDPRGNPTSATRGIVGFADDGMRSLAAIINPQLGPKGTSFNLAKSISGSGGSAAQLDAARAARAGLVQQAMNAAPAGADRISYLKGEIRRGLSQRINRQALSAAGVSAPMRGAPAVVRADSLARAMEMLANALKFRGGQLKGGMLNAAARAMPFNAGNWNTSTDVTAVGGVRTNTAKAMGGMKGAIAEKALGARIFLGNRGLVARSEINRIMKALSVQLSRKLYDFQSLLIKGVAKYIDFTAGNFIRFLDKSKAFIKSAFTLNNLFRVSEKFANGVVKMHKPLILLAENLQSIPGRFTSMVSSLRGFGVKMLDKAADAYIKGMYKLFMWPYSFQDAMSRGAKRLTAIFTAENLFKASEKFANAMVSIHKPFLRATNSLFFSGRTIRAMLKTSTLFANVLISMHKPLIRMAEIIAKYSSMSAIRTKLGELAASGINKVMTAPIYGLNAGYRVKERLAEIPGQIRSQTSVLFSRAVETFKGAVAGFRAAAIAIGARAVAAGSSGSKGILAALTAAGGGALALGSKIKDSAGKVSFNGVGNWGESGGKGIGMMAKLGGVTGLLSKAFGLLLKAAYPLVVLFGGLNRINAGEDAGRVVTEEGSGVLGAVGGGIAGRQIGAMLGTAGGPIGMILGSILGGVAGQLVGGFAADMMGMPTIAPTEAQQEATEKEAAINLIAADEVITIGEAKNLLESFYWEPIELVNLGQKQFADLYAYLAAVKGGFLGVLPTMDQVRQSLISGLSGDDLQSKVVQNLGTEAEGAIGAILSKMTDYYAAINKGTVNAIKAPALALADLLQRLLAMGPMKTVEDLQSNLSALANEWGANIEAIEGYNLYIGDATNETAKLSSAVDKLKTAFQRWSARLQSRIQMLFDKRLQKGLEDAKEKFESTYNVIVDGIEMSVKSLRDEIEAQEKKNKLLAIEKRIREATRNVELARLSQYDASVDPLEAAARMREAEEAKTEALKEAALERKKIALEEAVESQPYKDGIEKIEEMFEAVRLKFAEGMEDIMRQVEAGKLTAAEAVKKIEELYGVTLAEVGILDANLAEDAKNFGDSFLNTWDKTLKKFIEIVKKLKKAIAALKKEIANAGDKTTTTDDKPVDDPTTWRKGVDTSTTERMFGENSAATEFAAFLTARTQTIKDTTAAQMASNIKGILQNISDAQRVLTGTYNPFPTSDPKHFAYVDAKQRVMSAFLPGGNIANLRKKVESASNVPAAQGFAKAIYSSVAQIFRTARSWNSYGGGLYGGGYGAGTVDLSVKNPIKTWGMASGGTIMGPGLFNVGEAGRETLQVVPGGVARVFPRRIRPISGIGAAGGGGGGINASVIINNPTVRNDQDIRKLAEEVSRAQTSLLRSAGIGRI
jgi:hypothetical protein